MRKSELGEQYLRKAQIIKKKLDELEGELYLKNGRSRDDQYEMRRRVRLLFEMYVDCSAVGKRLIFLDQNRL